MEQQIAFIILMIIVIVSSVYAKIRFTLNSLSAKMSSSKFEQNKFEVIMQPKWFLFSTFIIIILWLASAVTLFLAFKWFALLYFPIAILVTAILSFVVPPSKKSITVMFFKTTHTRYRQRFNYNAEEEQLLIIANDFLSKLTGLKN